LEEGLAIVGENEILYGALGQANFSYFRWISKVDERYLHRAKECLEKAFALNPASSHGFALQGTIHGSEGDFGAAIRSLRRAVAIDPSNAEALLWLTVFTSYAGKLDLARSSAAALLAIDPYSPIAVLIQGVTSVYAGEFEGSLPPALRGVAMDPGSPLGHWTLAIVLVWCGTVDKAIAEIDELARLAPGWVYTHQALFLKHGLQGNRAAALAYATPELALEAKYDLHFALHVAHCYALIGENSTALDFLEHSVRSGMVNHPFLSRQDPLLENLRGEPRFHALMDEALKLHNQLTV
jgi:tetratricopeptide (TPR) repeat protein